MRPPVLFVVGLAALALSPAHGDTVLSGQYNDHPATIGDGYDTTSGQSYRVTPTAQFDHNYGVGLYAANSTVTVTGGQFSGNGGAGLRADGSTVTVTGGEFAQDANGGLNIESGSTAIVSGGQFLDNNFNTGAGLGAIDASLTVTGGQFSNNLHGLVDAGSDVALTGGRFTGNALDLQVYNFQNPASLDVYGDFTGDGFQFTDGEYSLPVGTGTLAVALENGGGRQTLTYSNGGTITLHQVAPAPAVPEPAPWALSTVGSLGLLALARRRRAA